MILSRSSSWPTSSGRTEKNSVSPEIFAAASLEDRNHSVLNTPGYPEGSLRINGQNKDHLSVLVAVLPADQDHDRKSFLKDEGAVAYLIFYILAALFVFGISYAILNDVKDQVALPIWNYLSPLGGDLNDSEGQWGFDFLNFLLSMSVTFFVIGLMWFAKQMAQKPEVPW
ncbi:MAG: hypothetical protein C3F06_02480 [Candidatus Methanoperedenaceae archaeon]|nr:MAG: hypothetical protein C3F06_02480 [Candidatus Methanoperedenaceae archaeon]